MRPGAESNLLKKIFNKSEYGVKIDALLMLASINLQIYMAPSIRNYTSAELCYSFYANHDIFANLIDMRCHLIR